MTGPELYALAHGHRCTGPEMCHWCGAPCDRSRRHDDPPPIPFARTRTVALYAPGHWECVGCYLWRRPRVTIRFLCGEYVDCKPAKNFAWLVTPTDARAIRPENVPDLCDFLLTPPPVWSLSLLEGAEVNHPQLHAVNENPGTELRTVLWYTVNGVRHSYTVYELEAALRAGNTDGREPGVRTLVQLLGFTRQKGKYERQAAAEEALRHKQGNKPKPRPAPLGAPVLSGGSAA